MAATRKGLVIFGAQPHWRLSLTMAFKYTPAALKKLETLFKEAGYIVRFERGNFTSGYCVLEQKKVVVINKFFDQDARINSLLDILSQVNLDLSALSKESAAWASELIAMRGQATTPGNHITAAPEVAAVEAVAELGDEASDEVSDEVSVDANTEPSNLTV